MISSRLVFWLTTAIGLYHLVMIGNLPAYLGYFMPTQVHNAVSIGSALGLIFLLVRRGAGKRNEGDAESVTGRVPWYDWILFVFSISGAGFVVFNYEGILRYSMFGYLDPVGMAFALALCIGLMEAVRRTIGWALPIIIATMVLGTIFQAYLPGLLRGYGFAPERLLFSAYVGSAGIFGLPLRIAASIIIVYMIFGALLQRAGTTRWFMDLALALTGWSRGGPAKVAVLSSAMFGSISGSPSANVSSTGVFTIPMMISVGYRPALAGAIEAVASTGGMILPPIMGSIAFIMAEWIGVSYREVVIAATVPALLYYATLFVGVHLHAHKSNIRPLPRDELPRLVGVIGKGWHHLIPIFTVIYLLIFEGLPPAVVGVYGSIAAVLASFLGQDRSLRLVPMRILEALDEGVRRWLVIAAITASVGIMIGALELSGVGIKISAFVVALSGGDLLLTLVLVGMVSLVVGMGLDATPAYITLATLMAPALVSLGVPEIAAHLYVVYWGLASFFTPPTCIAVFVAVGISGGRVWETGGEAVKLGIAAFLVPIAFVLDNSLLMIGDATGIGISIAAALAGVTAIAAGVCGFALRPLNAIQRVLFIIGGMMLIAPGIIIPIAGIVIVFLGDGLSLARRVAALLRPPSVHAKLTDVEEK